MTLNFSLIDKNEIEKVLSDVFKYSVDDLKPYLGSNPICSNKFKKNERIFHCKNCATDATCVFCEECFDIEKHNDHNVQFYTSSGGCCDCGDEEAWNPETFCPLHSTKVLDIKVPDEIRNAYISVLSISLQYVVTNLCEIHETLSSTKDPGNLSSEEFLFLTPTTDTNFTLDNNFSLSSKASFVYYTVKKKEPDVLYKIDSILKWIISINNETPSLKCITSEYVKKEYIVVDERFSK